MTTFDLGHFWLYEPRENRLQVYLICVRGRLSLRCNTQQPLKALRREKKASCSHMTTVGTQQRLTQSSCVCVCLCECLLVSLHMNHANTCYVSAAMCLLIEALCVHACVCLSASVCVCIYSCSRAFICRMCLCPVIHRWCLSQHASQLACLQVSVLTNTHNLTLTVFMSKTFGFRIEQLIFCF